jgi:ABC-2 type transport system ATP-binding protein
MSGLDPLGRRDVRALILRLRDRGCTVFFSSHVLADAEALCSRVAILVQGKLVATGGMSEIHAFHVRGWDLVVGGLPADALLKHTSRIRKSARVAESQYALELPLDPTPEVLLRDLMAEGAYLISLNPLRETLEDYFVAQVQKQQPR